MEYILDSNGRELLATLYLLKSFKSLIQGKVVKLYTDSKNASVIACKGSTSLRLQRHALEIFQFCAVYNVSIEIEWVSRSLNDYADSLSRVIDFYDWSFSTGSNCRIPRHSKLYPLKSGYLATQFVHVNSFLCF